MHPKGYSREIFVRRAPVPSFKTTPWWHVSVLQLHEQSAAMVCCVADIDECLVGNYCSVYAACNNTVGSYTCTCDAGYEGDGFGCLKVLGCSDSCGPHATCHYRSQGAYCQCDPGYRGNGCTCEDVDECQELLSLRCDKQVTFYLTFFKSIMCL